jgi:hypothetical protein
MAINGYRFAPRILTTIMGARHDKDQMLPTPIPTGIMF